MKSYSAENNSLSKNAGKQVTYCGVDDSLHRTEEGSVLTKSHKRSIGELYFFDNFKKMSSFFLVLISSVIMIYFVFAKPLQPLFDYENINTIISFGDSYSTRYLDMNSLTYACRNCTSAGGPNWVIYLTDATNWVSWDFAYNSAPVNNSIVNQVIYKNIQGK